MTKQERREQMKLARLSMRQVGSKIYTCDGQPKVQWEHRPASDIVTLHAFATHAANSRDPKFNVRKILRGWVIEPDALGVFMLSLLYHDFESIRHDYPGYRPSPYFEAVEQFGQRIRYSSPFVAILLAKRTWVMDEKSARRIAAKFNIVGRCLANKLRAEKRAYANFSKNAKNRYERLHQRVYAAMRKRSTLTILRLDTSYAKGVEQSIHNDVKLGVISPKILSGHRAEFGKYLHGRFGSAMLDYFGKAEYGKDREWHIHWAIILDAAKHQSDVLLTMQLGDEWKKNITQGHGHYWNCNANKAVYRFLAIGKVDVNCEKVRVGLRCIIAYFTLSDMFMTIDLTEGFRSFSGMINRLKLPKKPGKGRPSTCNPMPLFGIQNEDLDRIKWM